MNSTIDDPVRTAASIPWLDACAQSALTYGHCAACGKAHFYPRPHCPHCHASDTGRATSAGIGAIYSWTTVHSKAASYTLAYVRLEEGFTMLTHLVGDPPVDGWHVGLSVVLGWVVTANGQNMPVFQQNRTNKEQAA
ncbi:zinc ribbon domain-containing protein [Pseudacidovorax intermedius]|uniref:Zn-ribbon domain-containing OB-fold protein n=1 Tax=Pseudacidovorax intermedius TaxID=433924 RepID=UPI0009ECA437|nr:zinc ribbon domain-containing protein [Pseudacidovorax intermedius]